MTASSPLPAPALVPLMRYRDLAAALDWLAEAFGFEKNVAVRDAEGAVVYAQLAYGSSMLMLGAVRETDLDQLMRQPDEVGGIETQSCYVVVDNADEHHARAMKAGAEIVLPLKTDAYGRRGYSCRDPQGHIWTFGTYNPVAGLVPPEPKQANTTSSAPRRWALPAIAASLIAAFAVGWLSNTAGLGRSLSASLSSAEVDRAYAELTQVRSEKRTADERADAAQAIIERERAGRGAAEAAAEQARKDLAAATAQAKNLEKTAADLRSEIDTLRREKQAALDNSKSATSQLSEAQAENVALKQDLDAARQAAADAASGDKVEQAIVSAQPVTGPSETGTTTPPDAPSKVAQPAPTASSSASASARDDRRPAARTRRTPVVVREPIQPTYVIGLSDVPWPYNTWYRK